MRGNWDMSRSTKKGPFVDEKLMKKISKAKSGGGRCGMTVNKAGAKCTIHEKVKQRKHTLLWKQIIKS